MPVALAPACYGPTEMIVEVTSDVPCTSAPRTGLYVGPPFKNDPATVTEDCTPTAAGSTVGTLALVPGGESGHAAVKVVLAVGQRVDQCEMHPELCIVATRSFSYLEHRSLHLPIRLFAECLGKRCPEDQTCGAGGLCMSDDVTCSADGCRLPSEPPPGATHAPPDGGPPPFGDAAPSNTCRGPAGNGVVTTLDTEASPKRVAFGDGTFYFEPPNPTFGAVTLRKIDPADGAIQTVMGTPKGVGASTVALTTVGAGWAVAYSEVVGTSTVLEFQAQAGVPVPLANANNLVNLVTVDGTTAYIARKNSVDRIADTSSANPTASPFIAVGAVAAAVDATYAYVDRGTSISVYGRDGSDAGTLLPLAKDASDDRLRTYGGQVFAFGINTQQAAKSIGALAGTRYVPIVEPMPPGAGAPTSMAVDAGHVYFTDGASIWRKDRIDVSAPAAKIVTQSSSVAVSRLVVYGGCLYYWTSAQGQKAALRITGLTGP